MTSSVHDDPPRNPVKKLLMSLLVYCLLLPLIRVGSIEVIIKYCRDRNS